MSDTPRTDAALVGATHWGAVKVWTCKGKPFVYADFARELERENNQLRLIIKENIAMIAEQAEAIGAASTRFATVEQPGMNTGPGNRCEVACPTRVDAGLNPARGANLT